MITGKTGVYCVVGCPIEHSLSPVIHNAGFRYWNLDAVYVAFRLTPEKVRQGIEGLVALGVKGINVTVPLKELVYELVDEKDSNAELTGVVNTVVVEGETLKGYNTDVDGVLLSLDLLGFSEGGGKAVVLGAGGAARAVAAALILRRFEEIVILSRTSTRAERIVEFFSRRGDVPLMSFGGLDEGSVKAAMKDCCLLINTTPVGMYPRTDSAPIDSSLIEPGIAVLDSIYRPRKTKLISEAESKGCRVLGGMEWFIRQGSRAFELWTGLELKRALVEEILEKEFAEE